MKAVLLIEWELNDDEASPGDWHEAVQQVCDQIKLSEVSPRPVAAALAVQDAAERIMAAYHGTHEPVARLQESMDTLAKRGIVKG